MISELRSPTVEDPTPEVLNFASQDAQAIFRALASETTRHILQTLMERPMAPSRVASVTDTSIQNAQYHLGKLERAGLIEIGDTVYSEKGSEMAVYAPTADPFIVVAGRQIVSSTDLRENCLSGCDSIE